MIRKVWFEEFRALRDVRVDLEPLTVLVGPNASGKTSILEGIELTVWTARMGGIQAGQLWSRDRARGAEARRMTRLGLELVGGAAPNRYEVAYREIELPYPQPPRIEGETRACWNGEEKTLPEGPNFGYVDNLGREFAGLLHALPRVHRLRLDAVRLAAPSYSEEAIPVVAPDGAGLASVIADLATRAPEANAMIAAQVQSVIPALRRIRAVRAQVERVEQQHVTIDGRSTMVSNKRTYWGHSLVVDMVGGDSIPLAQAGEGTALAIGLMTVLLTAGDGPQLLLLDDLDRALHPKAQQDLVRMLRATIERRPGMQVVATTHSPFVLNELRYPEVRLTTLDEGGHTIVGALTDHPDYLRWKDHVQPGELWTSELEDWLRRGSAEAAE
jgi:predicted ATPase